MIKTLRHCILIFSIMASTTLALAADLDDLKILTLKAEEGDAYSQGILAEIHLRGEMGEINYTEGLKWAQNSAEQGHPIGLYNLTALYDSPIIKAPSDFDVIESYAQSLESIVDLAEQGDLRAQVNLGYLLEIENDSEENLQEALGWYEKAASSGFARAQYILGYKHYFGWGYDQDYQQAIFWLNKAAEQNYHKAIHFLGNMHFNGEGVPVDLEKAIDLYRKSESYQNNIESFNRAADEYVLNGIAYKGDIIIPGLLPPKFSLKIKEGSCGETCMATLINSKGFQLSQIEINHLGGLPGRGLRSYELYKPLDHYGFDYTDTIRKSFFKYFISFLNPKNLFSSQDDRYRDFLYKEVIGNLKEGNPVILGVKIYPDKHFFWDSDHFILLVGYNEATNEIIYNDFTQRKRIDAESLLDKTGGYSIINRYNFLNHIVIENFKSYEP